MKLLLTILIMISMKSYSQENLMLLQKENGIQDSTCILYIDTLGIGDEILETPEIVTDIRYQEGRLYGKGPFDFINHTLSNEHNLFEVDGKKDGDTLTISNIKDEYSEEKAKFIEYNKLYGNFKFKIIRKVDLHFEIIFDDLVNLDEVKNKFERIHSDYNFSFQCVPFFWLNSVRIPIEKILVQRNNSLVFNRQVEKVRITDFLGSFSELEYRSEIDISSYQRGVYILQFTYENEIYNYKFIKE